MGERRFAAQAVNVLAGGDHELSGMLDADAEQFRRAGSRLADESAQLLVELLDLFVAADRALSAPSQATLSSRIDSTMPPVSFGITCTSAERTRRAAASASIPSGLRLRLRRCLWGWFTSRTCTPLLVSPRVSAAPCAEVDSPPTAFHLPKLREPAVERAVSARRCGKRRVAKSPSSIIECVMYARVAVHPTGDARRLFRRAAFASY